MENYMKFITPEMTQTVNELKARNFKDATPDEIELYAEWNRLTALQDAEFQSRKEQRQRDSETNRAAIEAQAKSAVNALNALADLAKAKLKAVENGTQE